MFYSLRWPRTEFLLVAALLSLTPYSGVAQDLGTISGVVARTDGGPIEGAIVSITDLGLATVTGPDGRFSLDGAPPGEWVVRFASLGFAPQDQLVTVSGGGTVVFDAVLEFEAIRLADLVVRAASRVPERVVEAPAAISVLDRARMTELSITGQVPQAMRNAPGLDVAQSGLNDFNVNMRGFNTTLNRRVLVLQDGRDLALALLGPQEWGSLTNPLGDFSSVEIVRGPGSALFGPNAYSGVVDIRTYLAREVEGTKAAIGAGELSSLRADVRHAVVMGGDRLGLKVNLGYSRADSWTQSRTAFDGRDLSREYADATDATIPDQVEAVPLFGQSVDAGTGMALGDPDPIQSVYGAARMDYYALNGSVATVEGGAAKYENTVYVTDSGRIQMDGTLRPWLRLAWDQERLNLAAWYTGRNTGDTPQRSLLSGGEIVDKSAVMQLEGQTNAWFDEGDGRVVVGASARSTRANSELTLFSPAEDDRNDTQYSVFGQLEYDLTERLKVVIAARYDEGSLFDGQFSPRGAIVFTPVAGHSVRATINRAFLTPTQVEKHLRLPAAPPADFSELEAGMRQAFGEALAGVPEGTLFSNSSAVPILTLGNETLGVEEVTSYEIGYKGQIRNGVFLTADIYYSDLSNFVTDLLPGANPNLGPWTAPAAVPEELRGILEGAIRQALGPGLASAGLTRLSDGTTAIALSFGNAGDSKVYGVELGGSIEASRELRIDANYTFFGFEVDASTLLPGTVVKGNSPRHQANFSVAYQGFNGLSLGGSLGISGAYEWAAGVFAGDVPGRQTVDLQASYRLNDHVRVQGVATNLLDQQRFHVFGGSVIGRRVLLGLTLVR